MKKESESAEELNLAFQEALAAVDAGDIEGLRELLDERPELACRRLESPGAWLTEKLGHVVEPGAFFERPYLLWFLSEDAVRVGKLPANVAPMASTIIEKAREIRADNLQEQLDFGLSLVAWSCVAKESGVQLDLLDVFVEAGAKLEGNPENALVNGHFEAAEHLIDRGAPLTLASSLCLGRLADAEIIVSSASPIEKEFAFVLAALQGKPEALRFLMDRGVSPNTVSKALYSHGTALHHAVWSGSLDTVRVLVEAGANLTAIDKVYGGTPRGWAEYGAHETKSTEKRARYLEIAAYLAERGGPP